MLPHCELEVSQSEDGTGGNYPNGWADLETWGLVGRDGMGATGPFGPLSTL